MHQDDQPRNADADLDVEWREYPPDPRYTVGSNGAILGLSGRPMKPRVDNLTPNYARHVIKISGLNRKVHHVIAEAFLGPRPLGAEVDHLDGDPTNNAASNLEYVSHAENMVRLSERMTECKRGHSLTDAYLTGSGDGRRKCRPCTLARVNERGRRIRRERRELVAA